MQNRQRGYRKAEPIKIQVQTCHLMYFKNAIKCSILNATISTRLSGSQLANWIKLMPTSINIVDSTPRRQNWELAFYNFRSGSQQHQHQLGKHVWNNGTKKQPTRWIEIRQRSYLLTIIDRKPKYTFFFSVEQKKQFKSYIQITISYLLDAKRFAQRRQQRK